MVFSGNVRRIATVVTASDQASGTLRQTESAGDDAAESMEGTAASANRMRGAFLASAAATGALVGVLGTLVNQHGETEQTFARMAEVSGATAGEMEEVTATAKEIGAQLPVSMGDAAGAMEQLAFAGFSTSESVEAAAGVADLATASTMNMAEASRSASSLIRGFGLEAENMEAVTGAMSQTFSSSAANIRELDSALSRVAPQASALGVSIQESAAAVGVLADRGMRGQRAATMLRRSFEKLTEDGADETLNKIGVSMQDLLDEEGNLRDFDFVLDELAEGFNQIESNAERSQMVAELFGSRGARAMIPLLDATDEFGEKMRENFQAEIRETIGTMNSMDADELERLSDALDMEDVIDPNEFGARDMARQLDELADSGMGQEEMTRMLVDQFELTSETAEAMSESIHDGTVSYEEISEAIGGTTTASDIAASQMDTTQGAITFLRSSLDTMAFTIFEGAAPAIQRLNEFLARGINIMNNNERAMKMVGSGLIGLTAIFATLTAAIGAKLLTMGALGGAISSVMGSVVSFGSALTSVSGIVGGTAGAAGALKAAVAAAAIPLIKIVAIVGTVIATFKALQHFWENDIMDLRTNVMDLVETFSAAGSALKDAFIVAKPVFIDIAVILGKIVGGAVAATIAILVDAINIIVNVVAAIVNLTQHLGSLIGLWEGLSDAASATSGFLTGVWEAAQPVLSVLGSIASALMPLIKIIGGVLVVVGSLAVGIAAVVNPVTAAIGAIVGLALVLVGLRDVIMGIPSALSSLGEAVSEALSSMASVFTDFVDRAREFGANILSAITGGIRDAASRVDDAMDNVAGRIRSYLPFSNARRGPLSDIMDVGGNVIGAIVGGLRAGLSRVGSAASAIAGAVSDALGGLGDMASGVAGSVVDGLALGLESGVEAVKGAADAISGAVDSALGAAGSMVSSARDGASSVVSSVSDGISSGTDKISSAASEAASSISGALPGSDAEFGPLSNLTDVGPSFVSTISQGIEQGRGALSGVVEDTVGEAREFLPFSDAERGPLADLTDSGASMMTTIAEGVQSNNDVIGEAMGFGDVASSLTDAGGDAGSSVAAGMESLQDDPLDPLSAAQAASDELQSDDESSESGGRTEIVLSVEQDITINAEQSIDQIREQIEQLVEDGATDALRQLERKISNGEGLNV